jgi:hypothetical protein
LNPDAKLADFEITVTADEINKLAGIGNDTVSN